MRIVDPVEGALRAAQQPQLRVATPFNDVQLVALMAAQIFGQHGALNYKDDISAVRIARAILAEAVAQEHEEALAAEVQRRIDLRHPSEETPAGAQYVIPETR